MSPAAATLWRPPNAAANAPDAIAVPNTASPIANVALLAKATKAAIARRLEAPLATQTSTRAEPLAAKIAHATAAVEAIGIMMRSRSRTTRSAHAS